MKTIAVVDLSWVMHRGRHSLKELLVERNIRGNLERVPTGHIYYTLKTLIPLSSFYNVLVLAVDSLPATRKEINPLYKEGRHVKTGDYFIDYSVHNDTLDILNTTSREALENARLHFQCFPNEVVFVSTCLPKKKLPPEQWAVSRG